MSVCLLANSQTAYLHTCLSCPLVLALGRQQDLAELRGENLKPEQLKAKRQGADRVYGYQVSGHIIEGIQGWLLMCLLAV